MKKQLPPSERLYPMPCVLVAAGTPADAAVMAVAWINVVSSTPPTVAMGIRRSRATLECIRERREFTVNIATTSMATEVDFCGIISGRTLDKAALAGFTFSRGNATRAPILDQCPYSLECRVTNELEVGDYVVVFGEIIATHADEAVLTADGKMVDVDKLDPLVYIAGQREYRKLGEKVSDAFSVGKQLLPPKE